MVKHYVLAAGGTGGHMVPAAALAEELMRRGHRVALISDARGIAESDDVTVESARGTARFTATITDATRPGVVVIEGLWWHRFHPGDRNVNVLTSDRVSYMGGGPALHSNLVEIARA